MMNDSMMHVVKQFSLKKKFNKMYKTVDIIHSLKKVNKKNLQHF